MRVGSIISSMIDVDNISIIEREGGYIQIYLSSISDKIRSLWTDGIALKKDRHQEISFGKAKDYCLLTV